MAVFECVGKPNFNVTKKYSMLHVTPPMSPPKVLKDCRELVNKYYYADVDMNTLQHKNYPNVFALGDCSSGITSSAITVQPIVVFKNLLNVIAGKKPTALYDGYIACSIITGYGTCIIAVFDYNNKMCETWPWRQNKESRLSYYMQRDVLWRLYWWWTIKGLLNFDRKLKRKFKLRG
ncbi:hypothetical protein Trydic_g23505 [Trypoxylus dichotomus]